MIRADTACRFGAISYTITKCQELGYRNFALKTTGSKPEASTSGRDIQTPVEGKPGTQRDRHPPQGVPDSGDVHPRRPIGPGEEQLRVKLPPPQPIAALAGDEIAGPTRPTTATTLRSRSRWW